MKEVARVVYMNNILETSVRYLKGIGPKKAEIFNAVGITTVEDLLYYFPRRYEDRTKFTAISELQEGNVQTIKAEILAKGQRQSWKRRGFHIIELAVGDSTGKIFCIWFNQPYLKDYFEVGATLILHGKIERYGSKLQMSSPEFEIASDENDSLNMGRIVPVYSLPQGFTQRVFRRLIKEALDNYLPKANDFLPYDIRSRNDLLNLARSIAGLHFPENYDLQKQAYERISFEEFFLFQVPLALRKSRRKEKQGIAHKIDKELINDFIACLPFTLTRAQQNALVEISFDMSKPQPMQRLLQGDVGSGKTVVALIASFIAIQGGYQVAFMVPTEVLARQHYEKIRFQLSTVSCQQKEINIGLLISNLNKKKREQIYQKIKDGEIDLVIGTHALLDENVKFRNLGLAVIDEQHKFGVGQRALLPQKGANPDVLVMTATPIPRTLAITLYGDLDISVIKELPPGRIPIKTMHFDIKDQHKAYNVAKEQLKLGHQVYIVYPVIDESYLLDIAGAKKMYERLKNNEFKEFRLGLIHGKLKQDEQSQIMTKFQNKELDALITTTVLEVGIDIPEATCIIIEHAERFGLAQQHQLRGRVGRGKYESFCVLVSQGQTEEAKARVTAMMQYSDGFRIAEEDLKIRGPGEFFGRRQHGLSELKIGNPLTQMRLLKKAREEAVKLVGNDPLLNMRQDILLRDKLFHRFPEYEELVIVG